MSADRWSVCPRCVKVAESNREAAFKKAEASYGKVPADKYREMLQHAESIDPEDLPESLREDYGQGLKDGVYLVRYRCHCNVCGWSWAYESDIQTDYADIGNVSTKKGTRK